MKSLANVLVVGYGVVGKRVADAVSLQEDMNVCGIVDVSPETLVTVAAERGFPIYAADHSAADLFKEGGISVAGLLEDALNACDVVVDTTPKGVAQANIERYRKLDVPFLVNGGERAGSAEVSFNALANYSEALKASSVRVVSCNTTALCRLLVAIRTLPLERAFVVAIRRAADPVRTSRGPINAIIPSLGGLSHHAADVQEVMPHVDIQSVAVKVSSTLSHVHVLRLEFSSPIARTEILSAIERTPRLAIISGKRGILSNAHALEWARDRLRPRGDLWEVAVWEDSLYCEGREAVLMYCVHMESIAVPENIDAIRAMLAQEQDAGRSISTTDKALGCYKQGADYPGY